MLWFETYIFVALGTTAYFIIVFQRYKFKVIIIKIFPTLKNLNLKIWSLFYYNII